MFTTILETIGLFSVATLFGGMVFFPSVVAPTVFRVLDSENAGRFLRALFPGYYLFIVIIAGIGGLALYKSPILAAGLLGVAVSTLAVRQLLVPQINDWRDAELAGDATAAAKFNAGHRISVLINLAQMAFVAWALFGLL
ncbi:MAG: DUF4149 domain-containing protein [Pseudomonadota bacterium]